VTAEGWLECRTAQAPPALRARVFEYAASAPTGPVPEALAAAGRAALARVLDHPGDRSVALDLLAADALVTLALLAQTEQAPERLGAFASTQLRNDSPGT
jgi:hypothetical protein